MIPWTVACQAPLSMKSKSLSNHQKYIYVIYIYLSFSPSSKERLFIVLSAVADSPPRPSCSKSALFLVSNRSGHSSPQNRKITIKLQRANICPALLSYCSCHLKFLLFFSLKSGVLSSSFLFLGSTGSTTWVPSLHPVFTNQPPSFYSQAEKNMLGECEARTALHCPIIQGQLTYSAICRPRREGSLGSLRPVAGDLWVQAVYTLSMEGGWYTADAASCETGFNMVTLSCPCPQNFLMVERRTELCIQTLDLNFWFSHYWLENPGQLVYMLNKWLCLSELQIPLLINATDLWGRTGFLEVPTMFTIVEEVEGVREHSKVCNLCVTDIHSIPKGKPFLFLSCESW